MNVDPVHTRPGKAGRNEALKLRAGWMNSVSAGLFLAALIQPVLGLAQQQRPLTSLEFGASMIFVGLSWTLYLRGQAIARDMED